MCILSLSVCLFFSFFLCKHAPAPQILCVYNMTGTPLTFGIVALQVKIGVFGNCAINP